MNQAEDLHAISLFLTAVRELGAAPDDRRSDRPTLCLPRVFAAAAAAESRAGNSLAARFQVYNVLNGIDCPDFRDGLALARAAGLIAMEYGPSFAFFRPIMSGRQAARWQADPDYPAAKALAAAYLRLTLCV